MFQVHDGFVKRFLGRPQLLRDELRAILPATVLDSIDLDSLEVQATESVDAAFEKKFTDLLFKANLNGGGTTFLWIVVEHQSTLEPLMALRFLIICARIWEAWLKRADAPTRVPFILPILISNEARPWSAPLLLSGLYDLPPTVWAALRPNGVELGYVIDDLAQVDEATLASRTESPLLRLVLWALRARGAPDSEARQRWRVEVRRLLGQLTPDLWDDLRTWLLYVWSNGAAQGEQLAVELAQEHQAIKEQQMTWWQERYELGRKDGQQEGLQEGARGKAVELLLKHIGLLWGAEAVTQVRARVEAADAATLDRWDEQVVTGQKVPELFS